jgi:hypothetical protein
MKSVDIKERSSVEVFKLRTRKLIENLEVKALNGL